MCAAVFVSLTQFDNNIQRDLSQRPKLKIGQSGHFLADDQIDEQVSIAFVGVIDRHNESMNNVVALNFFTESLHGSKSVDDMAKGNHSHLSENMRNVHLKSRTFVLVGLALFGFAAFSYWGLSTQNNDLLVKIEQLEDNIKIGYIICLC